MVTHLRCSPPPTVDFEQYLSRFSKSGKTQRRATIQGKHIYD
eukprot:UN16650